MKLSFSALPCPGHMPKKSDTTPIWCGLFLQSSINTFPFCNKMWHTVHIHMPVFLNSSSEPWAIGVTQRRLSQHQHAWTAERVPIDKCIRKGSLKLNTVHGPAANLSPVLECFHNVRIAWRNKWFMKTNMTCSRFPEFSNSCRISVCF